MVQQLIETLAGNPTEVVIQSFSDRILVLITQLGKVGNLVSTPAHLLVTSIYTDELQIQASLPATIPLETPTRDGEPQETSDLPPPPPGIQLTPLLGNAQSEHLRTLHGLYASQIATIIWASEAQAALGIERRNVVVGIALARIPRDEESGLSDAEREVFNGVMGMIKRSLKQ